jgi:hypothetical protein
MLCPKVASQLALSQKTSSDARCTGVLSAATCVKALQCVERLTLMPVNGGTTVNALVEDVVTLCDN